MATGEERSMAEVIRAGVGTVTNEMYVARPAQVVAYDPLTNTIAAKLTVKTALLDTETGERTYEDPPEIAGVPVLWPRAGGYALTFPLEPGDSVLLVFNDVSIAEWHEQGGDGNEPADPRRHSIGYPVAIPGLFPSSTPLSPDPLAIAARAAGAVIGADGGAARIEFSPGGINLGAGALDFVALSTKVDAFINAFCGAVAVPLDGGLAIQTAAKAAWLGVGSSSAATIVKAK